MYACLYIYMPIVYVAFILDMKIIFNKIINNSRPPAWYFSLTRTGNKEFIIVGLILGSIAQFCTGRDIKHYRYYLDAFHVYTFPSILIG